MKINFVGDLILGDQPVKFGFGFDSMHSSSKYKNIFSGVSEVFADADYNIANFEAIIKNRSKEDSISSWSMCCDDNILEVLKNTKINMVSVANNHTMDYGLDFFSSTVAKLQSVSIKVIGLKDKPYEIIEENNFRIAVIAVSYLKVKTTEIPYFFNPESSDWVELFKKINSESVNKIILYVHWGNEFVENPVKKQIEILNELMDFKFDAIIGHHPHVLQPKYLIKETPVFFSLGNFVSDYWQKRARKTEIINLQIGKDENLIWKETPCLIDENGCPKIDGKLDNIVFNKGQVILAELEEVNKSRNILRKEYLIMLSMNFYKIKNKKYFISWLWRRLQFIVRYGRVEKKNPDIIYEKYKH